MSDLAKGRPSRQAELKPAQPRASKPTLAPPRASKQKPSGPKVQKAPQAVEPASKQPSISDIRKRMAGAAPKAKKPTPAPPKASKPASPGPKVQKGPKIINPAANRPSVSDIRKRVAGSAPKTKNPTPAPPKASKPAPPGPKIQVGPQVVKPGAKQPSLSEIRKRMVGGKHGKQVHEKGKPETIVTPRGKPDAGRGPSKVAVDPPKAKQPAPASPKTSKRGYTGPRLSPKPHAPRSITGQPSLSDIRKRITGSKRAHGHRPGQKPEAVESPRGRPGQGHGPGGMTDSGNLRGKGRSPGHGVHSDSGRQTKHGMRVYEYGKSRHGKQGDGEQVHGNQGQGKQGHGDGKVARSHLNRQRFHDRYKSGELDRITKGAVAKQVRLHEQFHMHGKGDVARRLDLHKHAEKMAKAAGLHHPGKPHHSPHHGPKHYGGKHHPVKHHGIHGYHPYSHYRGRVGASYLHSCFRFHGYGPRYFYHGPGTYAHFCWYPTWTNWVRWSWGFHCHPLWDPRPIWCRPIVYEPCGTWIYWHVPTWQPLPVVASGTWVDVQPVEVGPRPDLQLLAVRFVDPGHPEEKLGPRYRVWFRNNSLEPVTQPMDVMLLASKDERLTTGLPQAGVQVIAVEADDTQSVDVRLPFEVYDMARDALGNPVPFTTLHVLVDAGRKIREVSEDNNGVRLAQADILPVDPAAFEIEPRQAAAGTQVLLAGEGFGPEPGEVLFHMGGIEMQAEILGWYDLGVQVKLPNFPLAGPTSAELIVVRGADGAAANPLKVTVLPP